MNPSANPQHAPITASRFETGGNPLRLRAGVGERISAGILAAVALAVLITASLLRPAEAGVGTHTQLGLPACGWMQAAGYPCPTCGMTTSFAAAANAQPVRALLAQPFGAGLALLTSAFFWGALHVAVFGSKLGRIVESWLRPRVLWVALALFLMAWAYKVLVVRGAL
ncbi:MAG: DUF2752 domain-containing protein [Phycisphaerales bacterium]|nr:DUF2752 domain-containing protein [Phycisphaerales bacterium]